MTILECGLQLMATSGMNFCPTDATTKRVAGKKVLTRATIGLTATILNIRTIPVLLLTAILKTGYCITPVWYYIKKLDDFSVVRFLISEFRLVLFNAFKPCRQKYSV